MPLREADVLEVGVLGAVRARTSGREIALRGPRQRLVLAHLALARDHAVSVETLVNDLWEEPPRDPVHALQAHVSRLRAVIPLEISRTAAGYVLESDRLVVDAHTFEAEHAAGVELLQAGDAAAAAGRLEEALALWRGPALAGLLDSAALQPDAARLERMRVEAGGDRLDAYLACGRTAEAIVDLYDLVQREPLVERHWAQLMTALYLDGHVAEALETYRRARASFVEAIGAEPSAALQAIHQTVLRGGPLLATEPPEPPSASPLGSRTRDPASDTVVGAAPIVGRQRELAALERIWHESRQGLRVVTITGESGIGKTRLAAEFAAALAAEGARVLTGRCDEFLDVAHQPFVDVLRAECAQIPDDALVERLGPLAGELTRLLPELSTRLPLERSAPSHADPALERYHLMDALVGWLEATSRSGRLCLVVDDVQWADAETAAVFGHLLRSSATLPLLVVLTWRDHESAAGDARLAHLTRQSEFLTHLPLSGLSSAEVDELVSHELSIRATPGGAVPARFAATVREAAGGNPLFALELARQYPGAETAPDQDLDSRLPSGLLEVIRQRAGKLPGPVHASLRAAAVIGREFEPTVLAAVTGLPAEELDEHLLTGIAHRLIEQRSAAPLRFRFCHDAVRAALYDEWRPLLRADLHRRIAETLAVLPSAADAEANHLRLAHHYAHGSSVELTRKAAEHLTHAADLSSARRAYVAAARLYGQAIELIGTDADPADRCGLMIKLGTAEFYAGSPDFRDTLLVAAREAARTGHVRELVQAVVANHRGWYSSITGVDRERVELIELALLRCPAGDHAAQARLHSMWAMENVREPRQRPRVLSRSARAVQLAEESDDPSLLIDILCDRFSVLYATFEDPHGCVELAKRIEGLARDSVDEGHLLNAAVAVAQSTMMTGDFATSDEALLLAEALAARVHRPVRLWLARAWLATRTAMRGDLAHAEELAGAAFELGASLDQPDALTWFAGQLFSLRFLADRTGELVDEIEEQVAEHASAVPAWQAALAFTFSSIGRDEDAARIVKEFLAASFTNLPQDMLRLPGLAFLACTCARLGDAEAARAVYAELAPFTTMFAHNGTIDAGPVDLHLGMLAATFGDDARSRTHLDAAAQQCADIDAPAWGVHVDRWLARIA